MQSIVPHWALWYTCKVVSLVLTCLLIETQWPPCYVLVYSMQRGIQCTLYASPPPTRLLAGLIYSIGVAGLLSAMAEPRKHSA